MGHFESLDTFHDAPGLFIFVSYFPLFFPMYYCRRTGYHLTRAGTPYSSFPHIPFYLPLLLYCTDSGSHHWIPRTLLLISKPPAP